jgi:PPOX class probable F420-dependent enzyme
MSAERAAGPLPEGVRSLLEGTNIAHVATVMPDGSPHSVPVWVHLVGDAIMILTGPGSRKARNLDRDGRVALSIVDRDQPFTMAMLRGRVSRRLAGEPAWEVIDQISHKYVGTPYPRDEDRVVYVIEATHVQSQSYG